MERKHLIIISPLAIAATAIALVLIGMGGHLPAVQANSPAAHPVAAPSTQPAAPLADHVVINEFLPKGTEWVELYNSTATTVTITGWYVDDTDCGSAASFIGTAEIPPGGYYVIDAGDAGDNFNLDNSGDVVVLCDDSDAEVDRVAFGNKGGAPLAPTGLSAARVPNGNDTDDYARDWNMDATPTKGAANDAPGVDLGSSLILNEFDNYPTTGPDLVEIYNPTTGTITLTDWIISDGDYVAPIVTTATVAAGGWTVLVEGVDWTVAGLDFSGTDVGYLFKPDGTRVDQIGWTGEYENYTFQRIPDGVGPNDGYDWNSSGAPCHWRDLTNTLGATNSFTPDLSIVKNGTVLALPGDVITYHVSFDNFGGDVATGTVLLDLLPWGVSYITDNSGLSCPACTPGATRHLSWTVGTVGVCDPHSFIITAAVAPTVAFGSALTNVVHIVSHSPDSDMSDNTSRWATGISALDLTVQKMGPQAAISGRPILYSIVIHNTGIATATNVILTDTLPVSVTYYSDNSGVVPSQPVSGTLVWSLGDIPSNTNRTIHLTATVDISVATGTVLTNVVEVSTATVGDDPTNNSAHWESTAYQLVPIATARAGSNGDVFAIMGKVTYVPGTYNSTGWGLQDPSGGIAIYFSPPPASLNLGDRVQLIATRASYNGEEQMGDTVYLHQIINPGTEWPPLPFSSGDVSTGSTEGWLAQVEGYVSGLGTCSGYNYSFYVDDGSGAAHIYVDGTTGVDVCGMGITDGDYVRVVGFSSEYDGDYEIKPRFAADVVELYPLTLVYHDLEDVVLAGEDLYVAGDFNGWSTTATSLTANFDHSVFSTTFILNISGTYEYKYVVKSGGDQEDWLNTYTRTLTIDAPLTVDDYRNVVVRYAHLIDPASIAVLVGQSSGVITGEVYIQSVTDPAGEGRGVQAELGYGTSADPTAWTWTPISFSGAQNGNNDIYTGSFAIATSGVYSYAVRFDGNAGVGNPNAGWTYGDLDGVSTGDPFELANTGVIIVQAPDLSGSTKEVTPTVGVVPGDMLTYTINLVNASGPSLITATVTLTDYLPAEVTVVTTTLPGGMAYDPGTHTLTWSGDVAPGLTTTLVIETQVISLTEMAPGVHIFHNTAEFSDGYGTTTTVSSSDIVIETHRVYLPLVMANY